jgi:Lipocalin-like domain
LKRSSSRTTNDAGLEGRRSVQRAVFADENCNKETLVGAAVEGRKVMRKSGLQVVYFMLSLCITTGLLLDLTHAQTAKDLVGAWIAVSNVAEQGGVKSEPYGATPQGMLIFEADGRYGLILSRKDVPKFASNSRTNGTADENKAVVQGTISHFGRYTVSPADKSILFHIELSTYPNFNGTEQKRSFELVGEELKYTVPAFSGGGTAVAVWKRAK